MSEEPSLAAELTCVDPNYCEPSANKAVWRHCLYELFLKVADLVPANLTLAELFQGLAPVVQRIAECDFVEFSIHDAREDCFVRRFWQSGGRTDELKPRPSTDSISAWVWTSQQTLTIPDLADEQLFTEDLEELRTYGVRSYTALPVSTSLRRYGVLGLGNREPHSVNSAGVEFLSRVTRMLALGLENRETTRAWAEQQRRLQNLAAIGRELRSSLDPDELIGIIFRHVYQITKYDYAVLGLLEEDEKILRVHATDLPGWHLPFNNRVPLAEATSASAIQTRSITFLKEDDLARMGGGLANLLLQGGIRSVCNLPLLSGGRVLGTLNLGSKQRGRFRPEDAAYLQEIASHVAAALENANAYREIAQLRDRLSQEKRYLEDEILTEMQWDEIVGTSAALKRVLESATVVAQTNATVLVTGETGTGKELVAHIIHEMSGRKDCNFIKLNCAAIPTGLLESELFGHEKGAFTGAVSQKVGRLELADKGTLFLDEIGDIPLELQPKLLRVLQDYEFERLGGNRTIRVNVRLIAATNRDLGRAVEEKQFRRDLFYRLHVFPINLPSLRERREDIPLLVRHFVNRCAARLNKRIDIIPDAAIEAMMKWDWPGNIRELENFVERSVILSQGNLLRPPLAELQAEALQRGTTADDTLRSKEREHIIQVLRQTRGVLSGPSGAAARLGLKRTTLQYRMQKLGISRMDYLD